MQCNKYKIPYYIAGNSITNTMQFQSNNYKNPSFKMCVCVRERARARDREGGKRERSEI